MQTKGVDEPRGWERNVNESGMTLITIAVISLTVTVLAHIFVIARWSGRVDASLEAILRQPNAWTNDLNAAANALRAEQAASSAALKAELSIWVEEVKKLREARHLTDGTIQRHEGQLKSVETSISRVETRVDKLADGSGPVDTSHLAGRIRA